MPDILQTGSDWLADRLKAHASRSVVYRRDAEEVTLQATIGRTLMKLDDGYGGVRLEWTDRDFLIHVADLVLGAALTNPQSGDQIRETIGSTVHVYEVLAPGSEPSWRYSDPYHKLYRIHTKLIGTE